MEKLYMMTKKKFTYPIELTILPITNKIVFTKQK